MALTIDPFVSPTGVPVATAPTATATDATATTYTPTTGTASNSTATDWGVDSNQTVQGRMSGLLSQNSDYMKAATTGAMQQANRSGLLNSSMAAGAGQLAAIQSALPIAQQDASTYASAGQWNAGNKTQNSQFNANQNQAMTLANMNAKNQADQWNAGNKTDVSKFNANNQTALSQFNANNQTQNNQFNANLKTDLYKQASDQALQKYMQSEEYSQQIELQANEFAQQTGLQGAEFQQAKDLFEAEAELKKWLVDADNATKEAIAELDLENKIDLANIEANYKTLMETSSSARDLYSTGLQLIARIQSDTNMDAESKAASMESLQQYMQNGLTMIGNINGVDLTNILYFNDGDIGENAPAPENPDAGGGGYLLPPPPQPTPL